MQDKEKTKEQLIDELNEMRRKSTELEAALKELSEKESRYREIFDKTNQAIFVVQDGRIKFANRAATDFTGYSMDEGLAAQAIEIFVHPDDQDMVNQYHIRRLQGDNSPFQYEYRFVCKDGSVKWAEMNSSLIIWEEKPGGLCLATYITNRKRSEEALKDSRELILVLINSLPVGILYVDAAEQIVFANNTLASWWGKPDADLSGCTVEDILKDHYAVIKSDIASVLAGNNIAYERTVAYPDGETREIMASYIPHKGAGGEIKGFACLIMDVSQLKRIQRDLQLEREQLLSIFDAINAVIDIVDPVSHELLYMNKYTKSLIGHDAVGEPCYQVFHGYESPCDHCTNEIVMSLKGKPYHWEYQNKLWGRDFMATNCMIKWPDGRDVKLEFSTDITDRKRSEMALRNSEERYRAVFDNAGVGIDLRDQDGRIVSVNLALCDMLGYSAEEFKELTFTDITHPDDREITRNNLRALMSGELSSYKLEKRYLRKDGDLVWGDLSVSAIRGVKGEHIGTIGVIADITERKRAEDDLRKSEEKFQLLFQNAPVGYQSLDENGCIINVNQVWLDILGYSRDEVTGRWFGEFLHPDQKEVFRKLFPINIQRHDVIRDVQFSLLEMVPKNCAVT